MINPLDPYNVGGLWQQSNRHDEHIFNSDWGIWKRIKNLEAQLCEPDKCLKEHIFNPDWGIWKRINQLEEENTKLKEEVRKLKEQAEQLNQLESMLINAVNRQLGSI